MNTNDIISAIDAEISRLQQARDLLAGIKTTARRKPGRTAGALSPSKATSFNPEQFAGKPKTARTLSPEARARIAAAQKKRWANVRKKATA